MHRDIVSKLLCPACRTDRQLLELHAFREKGNVILDGVLKCPACRACYPVQDGLLELVVPELLDREGMEAFVRQWEREFGQALFGRPAEIPGAGLSMDPQLEQRKHFDWYADNEEQDYTSYQNTPFWRAEDQLVFSRWRNIIRNPDGWLLDIGCADGRSAFQWVQAVGHVAGCDISKKMIRKAIARARLMGLEERITFFVADADSLPLRKGSVDFACTYGVLHHLPNPGRTFCSILDLLVSGGVYFASENNHSAFRAAFDYLMRVAPLWTELAGEEPLISHGMVREWSQKLSVDISFWTSVFVPPHVINWFGHRLAVPVLRLTDAACRWVPWLGRQGGLIVFEAHKH